jgi:hypothetical protein
MELRVFGRTGMQLSVLGFGCGAVGGLMVRGDPRDQERTIARAIASGVNYFDTAVQYGNGESEKNLDVFCKSSNRRTWSSARRSGYRAATSAVLPTLWRSRSKAAWRDCVSIGSTSSTCTIRSPRAAAGKQSASDRCSVRWHRGSIGCASKARHVF